MLHKLGRSKIILQAEYAALQWEVMYQISVHSLRIYFKNVRPESVSGFLLAHKLWYFKHVYWDKIWL